MVAPSNYSMSCPYHCYAEEDGLHSYKCHKVSAPEQVLVLSFHWLLISK